MNSVKRVALIVPLAALLVWISACGTLPGAGSTGAAVAGSASQALTIFAAASLTDAFNAIGKNFETANPGVKVAFNYGASTQLAQQIAQGAPVDVFASANTKQMDAVIESGEVTSGSARVFVHNRLVMIYPNDNPARLKELKDLARTGVKFVTTAKEVPIGQYTLDFLDTASRDPAFGRSFKDDVLKNVVSYEENVRTVLSKVALGEADAGIVYTSDIVDDAIGKVGRIDIPDALNTIASYPIAPIKDSKNAELSQKFVDYVLTAEAQKILADFGFIPVTEGQ